MVHPFSSTDTATFWKKFCFILFERSYFCMVDNLSIAVHDLPVRILTSLPVDEMLLPKNKNGLLISEDITPSWLKRMNSVLSVFSKGAMPFNTAEILLGQVYFQEALDHLYSLHLYQLLWNSVLSLLFFLNPPLQLYLVRHPRKVSKTYWVLLK